MRKLYSIRHALTDSCRAIRASFFVLTFGPPVASKTRETRDGREAALDQSGESRLIMLSEFTNPGVNVAELEPGETLTITTVNRTYQLTYLGYGRRFFRVIRTSAKPQRKSRLQVQRGAAR